MNDHNTQKKNNKKREKNCHEDVSFEFSRTLMTQSLISAEDPLTKHDEESVHRRPKNRDKKREPVYEDLSKTTQHTNLELIMANSKGVLLRSRYCRLVFTEHKETYKQRYERA